MKGFEVMAKKAVVKQKTKKPDNVSKNPVNVDNNPATARKMSAKTKKKPVKTKPTTKEFAVIQDKKTHKLTPAAVQAILDLTIAGLSIEAIIDYIKEAFDETISDNLLLYYRRKNSAKLLAVVEDDIVAIKAIHLNSKLLVRRIGRIEPAF